MQQTLFTFTPLRLAHGVGMVDSLIGATALQHGHTLATFNARHFRVISGLVIVQPYERKFEKVETVSPSDKETEREWERKLEEVLTSEVAYRRDIEPRIQSFVKEFAGKEASKFAYRSIMCFIDVIRICGQVEGMVQMHGGSDFLRSVSM